MERLLRASVCCHPLPEQRPTVLEHIFNRIRQLFTTPTASNSPTLALALSGGGARSAYQAGVLRYMADVAPHLRIPILTGVSAGAINTAHLANHTSTFAEATDNLVESWKGLSLDRIIEPESSLQMLLGMVWPSAPAEAPTADDVRRTHGVLDTTPLWSYLRQHLNAPNGVLTGIEENLRDGHLRAVAVITTNYATGQTVTWVQGDDFDMWERPNRVSMNAQLTVDHVMASTALPLVFPAVRIGNSWYGDGGIRLSAPLAPAVHLGGDRILVISNRYKRSRAEASTPAVQGYPPAAQIIGVLMNALFADALDQDAFTLERVNTLVKELPPTRRHGMRPVELLQLRPSVDLGRLAHDFQGTLPAGIRLLTSGLGTTETQSPDWLSVLLFEPGYIDRLLDIGYHDAKRQHEDIVKFLGGVAEPRPRRDSARQDNTDGGPSRQTASAEGDAANRHAPSAGSSAGQSAAPEPLAPESTPEKAADAESEDARPEEDVC